MTSEHRALKHPLGGDVNSCPSGAASAIYPQHRKGDRAAVVPGEQLPAAAVALGSRWPRWTSSARGCAGLHVIENATASATAFTEQMRCHAYDSPVAGLPPRQDFTQRGYKKKQKKCFFLFLFPSKIHLCGRRKARWRILYTDIALLQKTIHLVTGVGGWGVLKVKYLLTQF